MYAGGRSDFAQDSESEHAEEEEPAFSSYHRHQRNHRNHQNHLLCLPARSRAPLYLPPGTELPLYPWNEAQPNHSSSPPVASSTTFLIELTTAPDKEIATIAPVLQSRTISLCNDAAAAERNSGFPAVSGSSHFVTSDVDGDDVLDRSLTGTSAIIIVDASLKPIEKLKRIVQNMQKQQYFRRDNLPSRKTPTPFVRSTASKLSNVSGSAGSRTDGGRSSLRLDKRPKAISYHHPSKAVDDSAIMDAGELLKENIELKHRLEDEEAKYERRLDTYRQAQQHQAALVSRLQAKVLQYKKRCSDLEGQTKESLPAVDILRSTVRPITAAPGSALDAAQQHLRNIENERITDLDSALRALNDERNRCEKLLDLNNVLREQLEEAQRTNEALTNDLQSLTTDWEQMRDEMLQKEDEWKQEEQFFNEYYTTEQNRILGLWRDINSMKEAFVEMQSTTRKDLNKLKNEITATSSNIVGTCNGILDTKKIVPEEKQQELLKENFDLQTRISVLKNECESLKEQSKMKDEKIQSLTKEIQKLNKKTQESTEASEEISHLQEEVQILLTGLREIAQTVVLDADAKDGDVIHSLPHVHLSSTMPSSSRLAYSEVGLKIQNASAFVESTISGVHAALHKYQSQIHELQIKISSQTEQLSLIERQCETQLDCQQKLTQKMNELVEELDSLRAESNILNQEKESLIKALEGTQEEKQEAVKGRNEMNNLFESLSVDYEKMLKSNNKLQKIALSLEEEKNFLHNEIDRMVKELETREVSCNLVEERCSRMLEELLTVKEDLTKARLDKELIEQHHSEAQSLLALTEKTRAEIESELQKVLMERTEVNDSLSKAENLVQTLEQQKRWLQDELRTTEEEKQKYQNQAADLSNDLGLVRKELVNTEQMRLDLEAERISLSDKYKNLDAENRRLEAELNAVINERAELNNEIVNVRRKKDTLNEELVRLRERIEQVGETNARINKHLEDLVKECEEKQVTLESNESEILHLQELNSLLKAERDSLEASLYETQNHLEISEMKRSTLEKQQQELLSKQETLKSEVQRLSNNIDDMGKSADDSKNKLVQQMKSLEVENAQTVERLKKENEETVSRIKEEKEQACINAEKKMLNALSECEQEKVDQISGMQKKLESLKQHMDMQCQQHEEALRRAESDKQQALLLAHQDQNALMDKLGLIRTELEEEKTNFEKFRREANLKTEQDRNNINSLRDQLTKLTSKIEDLRVKTEEEKNKLMQEIENVKKEREQQLKQCEDLKVELALAEDRLDNIRSQLFDTNHKLKEGEKLTETLRKDLNDIKRQLNESNLEKDKYLLSNKELREFVKKSEAEKREHVRSIEEANQKIIGLEDKLNQLENERARLQNICRDTDSKLMQSNQKCQLLQQEIDKSNAQNQQKENNEKELLLKLNIEIEDKEKAQQDLHNYKKQLAEMEANLDAYQQEINKMRQQTREEEERWHIRESELLSKLDGSRSKERKLEDQKHNLEVCLTESYQQVQDLKAKLSGCECRIRALESQLSQLENSKKQSEEKLKSINNTFKRLGLLQGDSSGETTSSTPLFRLRAARKRSPIKLKGIHDSTVDSSAVVESSNDFDADIIKKSIRSLVQQLAQAEREQDDMKIELENMKKRLNEGEENEKENEVKVNSMIKALRQTNEEKGILEAELSQKKSTLMLEMQTLKHKNEENQQLREKLIATEHHLEKCTEEKGQLEEKLTKIRSCNGQLEMEKDKLKEELSKCDSRSAKLEIQRISLEGDLNRLRMVLQDKDATIQKLQNRLETQCNTIADLEERCASLKATIDQLNVSLEFSATNETELRNEIQSLHKCLNDCSNTCQAYEEKIKQLHKSLTTIENERKLLNEKLDRAENALSDLQKESHIKDDQLTKLQLEVDSKDIQNASLHDQIRISKLSASSEFDDKEALHKLQIECCELRGKNQMLEERLRRLETDKRNLERKLASLRSKSYDRSETGEGYDTFPTLGAVSSSMMNVSLIEHENKDLKEKCNRLEAQLHEKETELTRLRMIGFSRSSVEKSDDLERYRAGQLHAEHLLKAREQSHRQQIEHLKNEIANLKKRLDQETKFRKKYLMESIGEAQNVRQLRDTLANSLRAVSENPSLDALLLDHETRKLNSSVQLARSKLPRTHSILRK